MAEEARSKLKTAKAEKSFYNISPLRGFYSIPFLRDFNISFCKTLEHNV